MAGNLMYAKAFDRITYVGADGREHYELKTPSGYGDVVSNSTFAEAVDWFTARGVPSELWPVYEEAIDLDLSETHELSEALRKHVGALGAGPDAPRLVSIIIAALNRGDDIFYAL